VSKIIRKLQVVRRKNQKRRLRQRQSHEQHEANCDALCCARSGQSATVLRFAPGCREAERLREMGLREGATVQVLRDGDPLMVRVEDARFGIGRQAAMQVLCELSNDER
jgi:Fe2+ transport system protein FeoA